MTNRELLREIRDIKKSLSRTEENLTLTDQAEELQEVFEKQEEIEMEIARLESQLADPSQFYSVYNEEIAKKYIAKVNNTLQELEAENKEIAAVLSRASNRLQHIASDLKDSQELLDIAQQEEIDYENANNEGKTVAEIAQMEESIQKTRRAAEEIKAYRDALIKEREQFMTYMPTVQERQAEISDMQEEWNRRLTVINQAISEGELLDRKKMDEDRLKLQQAKQNLNAYNAKEAYLSFNCINELENLEDDIRQGEIDKDQIVARLQTIQDRAPYLPVDVPAELEDNEIAQRMTEEQITVLQERLKDDENYVVSKTEFETLSKDIGVLEARQAEYETREKENEAFLAQKTQAKLRTESDIDECEETLKDLDSTIAKVQEKLTKPQISKKERRELEKDMHACRQESDRIRKQLEELYETKALLEQQIQTAKMEQKRIPKLQTRVEKLLSDKQQRLGSKNFDALAKKDDEEELQELTANLNALKARETYLRANIADKFDVLISKVQEQELTTEKEKFKKGFAVIFDKINKNVIEKIKSSSFQTRVKSALGAVIIAVSSITAVSLFKNSSVKLARNGIGKGILKIKDFDFETDRKLAHQIQIDKDTYEYEIPETNPDLEQVTKKSIDEMALEVIQGKWGNGSERKESLREAGYTDAEITEIQQKVNEYYNKKQTVSKPITPEQKPTVSTPEAVLPPEAFETNKPQTPGVNKPDQIITGPIYTVDGDEDIRDEIFHPVTPPRPERPSSKPTIDVKVNEGDTLLIETDKGVVAVDNSDGRNYADVDKDVSFDYTSSSAIDSVHYDDKTGAIDVTIDKSEITPQPEDQTKLDQQILDDYEQILREMGISSTTYGDTGRTR